jgi:hypothetical protein
MFGGKKNTHVHIKKTLKLEILFYSLCCLDFRYSGGDRTGGARGFRDGQVKSHQKIRGGARVSPSGPARPGLSPVKSQSLKSLGAAPLEILFIYENL